ncbi:autotransporter-associated beta strand protein [Haloferula luteola]|uniref:Autotransporter-associated beta strand protein n=1 Tax=Haloferula luteola TaxID=595692 RepID=A0A840V0P1_9BACT|nr:discoidin domain-containing protein [Haloferula luteola]MBB5351927.1 autotransporter-associated beta strand protein [Haloferula luteola]
MNPSSSRPQVGLRQLLLLTACTTAVSQAADFRYYRFTPTQLRNDVTSNSIQISEIGFFAGFDNVDMSLATVTNPGGRSPAAEIASNVTDGNTGTKWLDFNKAPLVFDFGTTTTIDGYFFATPNDATDRDAISWILEGSADGTTWTLLDNVQGATIPEERLTYTDDFNLPSTPEPIDFTWTGNASTDWNTTEINWSNGSPVIWDNTVLARARFGAGSPTAVTLSEGISARVVRFDVPNYTVEGDTLTLVGVNRLDAQADATLGSTLTSASGIVKIGPAVLSLTGDSSYPGTTFIQEGTLAYTGSATRTVVANLEIGRPSGEATLEQSGESTVVFGGNPSIGTGADSTAIIRQSGGSSTYAAGGGYLTIANATNSFAALELSGGTLASGADSGIRLGLNGTGNLLQTGGDLTSNRWFAVGGENATGVATHLGGTTTITSNWRLIVGDRTGSTAVVNVGTLAGGDATVTGLRTNDEDGSIIIASVSGALGYLNLNHGTLVAHGSIYQGGGSGFLNVNGGTLQAGREGVVLVKSGLSVVAHGEGLHVDTAGFNASITADIFRPYDSGLTFPGSTLAVSQGGSGYLTPPVVQIESDGAGLDALAVAEIENGAVTSIVLTNPGEGFEVGDELTIHFVGGGTADPAPDMTYVLTAANLEDSSTTGWVKTGEGKLNFTGTSDCVGPTVVEQGTLAANGTFDETSIEVASGATLTGHLDTLGPVTISGTFAPGDGVGTATGASSLSLLAGSQLAIQVADWTGTAGTGYDTASFNAITTTATSGSKLTVTVDGTDLVNFSEGDTSFIIASAASSPTGWTSDNWQVNTTNFPGTGTWDLAVVGNDLVLEYTAGEGGYSSWIAGFPGITDASPDADPDQDGLSNLLEYILNGNPTSGTGDSLPQVATTETEITLSYIRRAESATDTTQVFETSSDLVEWSETSVPASSSGSITVAADTPEAGLETVTLTLPRSEERWFGRLKATRP